MIGLRFFPLNSADFSEVGTRNEPLRTSAWDSNFQPALASSPSDETMEAIKRKIEEADDIADVTALMINLNIATKGCKTLQQMTDRICENLNDRRDNLDPNKVFAGCNKYMSGSWLTGLASVYLIWERGPSQ